MNFRQRLARGLQWPRPNVPEGEALLLEQRANWSRRGIARGGTLFLTESRVLFEPNSREASIGLAGVEWPREELASADMAPRGWNPFSGALRRRLRLTKRNGTALLFVVEDPASIIAELNLERKHPLRSTVVNRAS